MSVSICPERLHHPTRHAADGEDRHEQIALDAEQVVDHAGTEIDVDVDAVARIGRHNRFKPRRILIGLFVSVIYGWLALADHADGDEVTMKLSSGNAVTWQDRCRAALPYLVVLAAGIFLYYAAENFEFEQASGRIGPGAWPKLVLVLLLASALWGTVSSAMKAGRAAEPDAEADATEALIRPPELYPWLVWLAVAATLGYLVVMPLFGFFAATTVYSFVLIYLGHYRRPLPAAALSVAIAFAFMFMFMRVVYVALPVGVAPFDQLSYALMAAMGVH